MNYDSQHSDPTSSHKMKTIMNIIPDWQPIETAPKDGTRILVYRDDFQRIDIVFFDCDKDHSWDGIHIFENGIWVLDDYDFFYDYKFGKYWMPLPELPKE